MPNSPRIGFQLIAQNQASLHVPLNLDLYALDALLQAGAISNAITAPPGAPAEGDAYIVPTGATGLWAPHVDAVACFQGGGWRYYPPNDGWLVWVQSEGSHFLFGGGSPSSWQAFTTGGGGGGLSLTVANTGSPSTVVEDVDTLLFADCDVEDLGSGTARVTPLVSGSGGDSGGGGGLELADLWTTSLDDAPVSPDAMDDEFNDESFDAGKWTWVNQGLATVLEDASTLGHLLMSVALTGGDSYSGIYQAAPVGTWIFRAKVYGKLTTGNFAHCGLFAQNATSGKIQAFGPYFDSGFKLKLVNMNNPTSFSGQPYVSGELDLEKYYYLEIEQTATDLLFRVVAVSGPTTPFASAPTLVLVRTESLAGFLASVDRIGIFVDSHSANIGPTRCYVDWFRRIA